MWLDDNPKYTNHYVVIEKPSRNELTWIACKCTDPYVYPPNLPPTPKYDFLIDNNSVEIYRMASAGPGKIESSKDRTIWLHATDPSFFQKLEHYLDDSH